ncbi:MAG: uroporphyrinogen-III synthase [Armatimonadota bacterium]|nr:uroporphyrinogen-III synthase [Armatimonadota bacterium]
MSDALPLAGCRILVTRPRAQSRPLVRRLQALGAEAHVVPAISIEAPRAGGPLDQALLGLGDYDWVVVTSANGARACISRAGSLGVDLSATPPRWAAIGPATARVLRRAGVAVAMTPSRFLTEAIADELHDVRGRRILLPRTEAAPPGLAEALRRRGAAVDEVAAYRTVLAPTRSQARLCALLDGRGVDTVIFTSASTVRGLLRLLGDRRDALRQMDIACIGPVTAAAVRQEGFDPSVVAEEHTVQGLVSALVSYHTRHTRGAQHAPDRAAR